MATDKVEHGKATVAADDRLAVDGTRRIGSASIASAIIGKRSTKL
jgi:hypothetical protein